MGGCACRAEWSVAADGTAKVSGARLHVRDSHGRYMGGGACRAEWSVAACSNWCRDKNKQCKPFEASKSK